MPIIANIETLIGNTPLISLSHIAARDGVNCEILAKLECQNPFGSVKDRVAKEMIYEAERQGILAKGATIIEPTSGNTGIALAALGKLHGYTVKIVMPDTMSAERIKLMRAYGAEVILTPGKEGMAGAISCAKQIAAAIPNSWIPSQFDNPSNPMAHFKTTGPEIYEATHGNIDAFVCGVGTGGSITGVGRYLKSKNPAIQIVAVEPASSPYLSQNRGGLHKIQGIGAGFVPENFDSCICDQVICVEDEEAYLFARRLVEEESLLVGISAGAAVCAAIRLAKSPDFHGKRIATLLPDTGMRYLSEDLFTF